MYRFILLGIVALFIVGCSTAGKQQQARIGDEAVSKRVKQDRVVFNRAPIPEKPLTIEEAMAMAMKYNLDARLKRFQAAFQQGKIDTEKRNLLPELTANAGYNYRDRPSGSTSRSLLDGTESLVASTSEDQRYRTASASLSWNLLDFSIAYYGTKQERNELWVAREQYRKTVQNIAQDVRASFWRAAAAQVLRDALAVQVEKITGVIADLNTLIANNTGTKEDHLRYKQDYLVQLKTIFSLSKDLDTAMIELLSLIGVADGHADQVRLVIPDMEADLTIPSTVSELVDYALENRPELIIEDYRKQAVTLEQKKAFWSKIPIIGLTAGINNSTNSFLFHNTWASAGATLAWDFFNLARYPAEKRLFKQNLKLTDARRQSLGAAIIAQVCLAYYEYRVQLRDLKIAVALRDNSDDLKEVMAANTEAEVGTGLDAVKEDTDALISKIEYYNSYAAAQNALGRVYNSIGVEIIPLVDKNKPLSVIVPAIKQHWEKIKI